MKAVNKIFGNKSVPEPSPTVAKRVKKPSLARLMVERVREATEPRSMVGGKSTKRVKKSSLARRMVKGVSVLSDNKLG